MKSLGIFLFAAVVLLRTSSAGAHNEETGILNLPSSQTTGNQVVLFDVGHRYLDVNRHTTNINLAFGYGLSEKADIKAAYSFKNKDSIISSKYAFLSDLGGSGSIVSFALAAGAGYKDINQINNTVSMSYFDSTHVKSRYVLSQKDRFSYFVQAVAEKHFFDNRLSLGIVPSLAWNTDFYGLKNSQPYTAAFGFDAAFYFGDRFAVCAEIIPKIFGFSFKYMNYNAGLKYTGFRHTFALWIGNSSGYSPVEYLAGSAVLTPKICASFTREFDI